MCVGVQMSALIRLYNADALKFPLELVKRFHVMYTDPPYSAHVHKSAVSQSGKRGARKRDLGFEHLDPVLRRRIGVFASLVRGSSLIYSDIESSTWLRLSAESAGAEYIRTLPWIRWSMAQLSGDRPPSGMEHVVQFWGTRRGPKSWTGPNCFTHFKHKCLRGEAKHKAAKPLDQCLDIVSWYSKPGETIFDPFAGHSPIGVACLLLGRGYVGLELSENCWWRGCRRIARAKNMNFSPGDMKRIRLWMEDTSYEPVSVGKSRLAMLGTEHRYQDKQLLRLNGF